ncbi:hypothetical protein LR48_Vigan66s002700 [Vigna angularis]|uniref:non-specific serine/threonine protein kinase n=1 Tax=Phaseolus angularis TaxID=3914 RepID=A0A0L9T590_PHAAN|nr:hypothetical protein LR48_Vigan66s002700 [Vigna angularis]
MQARSPVRVIFKVFGKFDGAFSYSSSNSHYSYVYDGLYLVDTMNIKRRRYGKLLFKFELNRILGQSETCVSLKDHGENSRQLAKFSRRKKLKPKVCVAEKEKSSLHSYFGITNAGLPPSPPSTPSDGSVIDDEPNPGHDHNGMMMKPLGVDVPKKKKGGSNGRMIVIIVLSSVTAFVVFIGLAWICALKCCANLHEDKPVPDGLISSSSKQSRAEKETGPLDWNARMKIALGAARGLAYLHEDSNPCVIHWDFKASNILLEYDFTPKVSDF